MDNFQTLTAFFRGCFTYWIKPVCLNQLPTKTMVVIGKLLFKLNLFTTAHISCRAVQIIIYFVSFISWVHFDQFGPFRHGGGTHFLVLAQTLI